MTIELLPHNQMLYNKILTEMFTGAKSIFYSEGTGLGKSYIFMALVQNQFRGKHVLYIVPKIAIFSNLEHYAEFQGLDADITYTTFAAFNTYEVGDTRSEMYDVVFVDECHHMLSDIQGSNVYKFMCDMLRKGKYCFGMTATPCYRGVFVDEKYFETSCYGYDVFEAITQGLMPKIDIALADIDLSVVPKDMKASYSITGTKTVLETIIERYSHVMHWLAYFSSRRDLEANVSEMEKLFPEFKILKLYVGITNAADIIKEFEESAEKIVLMSVSMLLEGMHLENVGGVLLYRNVVRNNTYFQVYGRLCRLFAEKSPVLVDVTNSITRLGDFPMFKSPRAGTPREFTYKDIFDVNAYGYQLLEFEEISRQFKVKEYRGVRWTSDISLSRALGLKTSMSVGYWVSCGKTRESYIDYKLQDSSYSDYVANGFVGYSVCGDYKYRNWSDLAKQLGVSMCYNNYTDKHPDASVEDYISWAKGVVDTREQPAYRGVDITSQTTVAQHFGLRPSNVSAICIRHGWTLKEYVDNYLDCPSKRRQKRKLQHVFYRNVDITFDNTIAEHFGVSRPTVAKYIEVHNLTKEAYVDLRLDHPEVFRKCDTICG